MEKKLYRGHILVRHKMGKTPIEIYEELRLAYSDAAPSYMTVTRWILRFKEGTDDLKDFDRPGRPITAVTSANIDLIRRLIDENRHISYNQITAETSLGSSSIHEIIHVHLKLRKVTSCWVPYVLSEAQKKLRFKFCMETLERFESGNWSVCDIITANEFWIYLRAIGHKRSNVVWLGEGESPPASQKRNQYEHKSMFTVFFRSTGVVFCLESGKTVTAKYYRDNCLKPALERVRGERPTRDSKNIKIWHDNAKPHVAKIVKDYLNNEGIKIIDHPPYSPDLSPFDFWLFSKLKHGLDSYPDVEITEHLENIPKEEYLKTFQNYLERMQLCIKNHGDYFEHLIK